MIVSFLGSHDIATVQYIHVYYYDVHKCLWDVIAKRH